MERIEEVNPTLRAVGELNPDALHIARTLDLERSMGRVRGQVENTYFFRARN